MKEENLIRIEDTKDVLDFLNGGEQPDVYQTKRTEFDDPDVTKFLERVLSENKATLADKKTATVTITAASGLKPK